MKENVHKQFGENYRRIRKSKKLTQEFVAERSGTTSSYISELELGKANPTLSTIINLANGVNVDVAELFIYSELTQDKIRDKLISIVMSMDSNTIQSIHKVIVLATRF